MTLLSDEPFFRWLPDDEDEITRHFGRDGHTVQSWVTKTPNTERQLDRHDPYAATTALDRPFPSTSIQERMKTEPDDPVVRYWSINGTTAFRAEAWGADGGRGEQAWSETGSRLFIKSGPLLSLLDATKRSLVVALKLRKYHKGKSSGRSGDTSGFTHRSLVVIINGRGHVWAPRRLSQQAKQALATLDPDRRRDFYARFRAIAGLPDEWLARRNNPPVSTEQIQIFIEGLSGDEQTQL
jgi:hypothetical protein